MPSKTPKKVLGGKKLVCVLFNERVEVYQIDSGVLHSEFPLYKDTGLRVAISSDDKWLVIGSWTRGIKIVNLCTMKIIEQSAVVGMAYLDVFSRRSEVCCGLNAKAGSQIVCLEEGLIKSTSRHYDRIVELKHTAKHADFSFDRRKLSILDADLGVDLELDWPFEVTALVDYSNRLTISGMRGELLQIDLLSNKIKKRNQISNVSRVDMFAFDNGKQILKAVVSEFQYSRESALVVLDENLQILDVMRKFNPIAGFCTVGDLLILRSGAIISLQTGEILGHMIWGGQEIF